MSSLLQKIKDFIAGLIGSITGGDLTIKNHRASFLFDSASVRVMNILSHNISESQFKGTLNRCKKNGDTVVYVFGGYNKGDGPGTTSFYVRDSFGGQIDQKKLALMKGRYEAIRKEKMNVVAWLFADDNTKNVNFKDVAALKAYIKNVFDNFDKYISEYVVALEADEYLSRAVFEELARYLRSLTKKPIGSHQTPARYDFSTSSNVSKHYHQYGFNKSSSYIEAETRKIAAALKKPVIGAEYDMSSDTAAARARGDAVMRGGGSGTGNGRN